MVIIPTLIVAFAPRPRALFFFPIYSRCAEEARNYFICLHVSWFLCGFFRSSFGVVSLNMYFLFVQIKLV